ncbi:hypothetical protein GOD74_29195 [Sinorhizobium medicae]|nr:hypothetical protein [Sinorhizobium medicae]
MAPDLALLSLDSLPPGSTILDPMVGSGTVVRHALELGHEAIGCDLDPLAVLMSRVWTTPVSDLAIQAELEAVLAAVRDAPEPPPQLAWQQDEETAKFISYWFHENQRCELSKIAAVLHWRSNMEARPELKAALDLLRVAFSRIIITKEQGASLARDTSHSRPHRVTTVSDYEVLPNFERSIAQLRKRMSDHPLGGNGRISLGDARALSLGNESVDAVITSPPYLNAIDYMRGHRMSLVWLGYSIPELRSVRSSSIGAERAADHHDRHDEVMQIAAVMRGTELLSSKLEGIIGRYALDLILMTSEVARVLKAGGKATFVVGNSCIRGQFINNASGVAAAAERSGLRVIDRRERDLPASSRYLPVSGESLSKRMRTETILVCRKYAEL